MEVDITELKAIIDAFPSALRTEVIVAQLIGEFGSEILNNLVINPQGLFENYRKSDILLTEEDYRKSLLFVNICRNGLYDGLPQALIHDISSSRPSNEVEDMIETHKKLQEEKKNAQTFFLPFEQEFFRLRLFNELQELKYLYNFEDDPAVELQKFWEIPEGLFSKSETLFFIHLLPMVSEVTQNKELVKLCFEYIFRGNIEINTVYQSSEFAISPKTEDDSSISLGENWIMGSCFSISMPVIQIKIGPISKNRMDFFLNDKSTKRKMDFLIAYLLPVGFEVQFDYQLSKEEQNFVLDSQTPSILGYASFI